MFTSVTSPTFWSPIKSIQGTYAYGDGDASTKTTITYSLEQGWYSWSASDEAQLEAAMEVWESVANIEFVETTETADIEVELFANFENPGVLGFMGGPLDSQISGTAEAGFNGDFWYESTGNPGGYFFATLLHELGHGLGLGHPHDYGFGTGRMFGVSSAFDDYGFDDLNQGVFTVMSYNDGWHSENGDVSLFATYGSSWGLGALDVAAIQAMYGANTSYNDGSDVYVLSDANVAGTGYGTIWDTGGTDEIAYSGAKDAVIDLRQATLSNEEGGGGYVSHVDGILGGYTISNGVVIEAATSGDGDDRIIGNNAANTLTSNAGNDIVSGGIGNDTIDAGTGVDYINGGSGDDTLLYSIADANSDTIIGGSGTDTLVLDSPLTSTFIAAQNGADTEFHVWGGVSPVLTTSSVEFVELSDGTIQSWNDFVADNSTDVIEDDGGVTLRWTTSRTYVLDTGTDQVELRYQGTLVDPSSMSDAGYTVLHAESTDTGYVALMQDSFGNYLTWDIDSTGNITGGNSIADVRDVEDAFGLDFDGDGTVGHILTAVESDGDVTLNTSTNDTYVLDNGTSQVALSYLGSLVNPMDMSAAGWNVLHAEGAGAGYVALLQNDDGSYVTWDIDSVGNITGGNNIDDVRDVEDAFDFDFDGDGTVGHILTAVESDGDVTLNTSTNDTYVLDNGTSQVALSYLGSLVNPADMAEAGWTVLHAEDAGAGYVALLQNSAGTYATWAIDGSGNITTGTFIDDVRDVEDAFVFDFDGDGTVGHILTAVESDGDVVLNTSTNGAYVLSDTSGEVAIRQQGTDVGPNSLSGWSAIQAEDDGTGGYSVLWENVGGGHAVWNLDASGTFVSGETVIDLTSVESLFEVDLTGDGMIG